MGVKFAQAARAPVGHEEADEEFVQLPVRAPDADGVCRVGEHAELKVANFGFGEYVEKMGRALYWREKGRASGAAHCTPAFLR